MKQLPIILAITLLLVSFSSTARADGTVNGYLYRAVTWSLEGYLTMVVVNDTGDARHAIQMTIRFEDVDGNTLLEKTLFIGSLNHSQVYELKANVGPRKGQPANFTISFSDDRLNMEAEAQAGPQPGENAETAVEPTFIDMTFTGDAFELTDSFELTPGTYFFMVAFSGEGDFSFRLADNNGTSISDIYAGANNVEQTIPLEIPDHKDYRVNVNGYGDWTVRILDAVTMEKIRKQRERNQFDVQQSDDGTLVITN